MAKYITIAHMAESEFRRLPSVDKLLSMSAIKQLEGSYPHTLLVEVARRCLDSVRLSLAAGKPCPPTAEIVAAVLSEVSALGRTGLRPVINATGVVLHTNLGRALLSEETIAAMDEIARGYCNLEFELDSGKRGHRHVHIRRLLCQVTGAEAGLVVNNNASGVLLVLSALAKRREVIISRDQAVEIGGGFRIPDVMRQSGARLVEVGTTNCTYIADYEQALSERTAALMRVHSSNFKLLGYVHSVTLEEMAVLGGRHGVPVFDDVGSGCLLDTTAFGLEPEPMVQQSIAQGAGLVLFSADKLLGGPQAGVIVGKKELVARLEKHPLVRAMRIDKVRLAGLVATLLHYLKGEVLAKVPLWRMVAAPLAEIEHRAGLWAQALGNLAGVVAGESMVGGGSLPGSTLPSRLVSVGGPGRGRQARNLSEALRRGEPPVIGRVSEDTLLLDPRSVLPEEDGAVIKALQAAAAGLEAKK